MKLERSSYRFFLEIFFLLILVGGVMAVRAFTGPSANPPSGNGSGIVPTNAVIFFNGTSCPAGWTELTAARGRYIVGLNTGGTLASTAGTALTNLENRTVGKHSHTLNDPGHTHQLFTMQQSGSPGGYPEGSSASGIYDYYMSGAATTGMTENATGTVDGTNAPYLQLLVCAKN